jgi:hypothetical protein
MIHYSPWLSFPTLVFDAPEAYCGLERFAMTRQLDSVSLNPLQSGENRQRSLFHVIVKASTPFFTLLCFGSKTSILAHFRCVEVLPY